MRMNKRLLTALAMFLLLAAEVGAEFWGVEKAKAAHYGKVWEAELPGFTRQAYRDAVARLFTAFEESTGKRLVPGAWGRAGIKIDTNSGAGLSTPPALTEAVVEALVARGFERGRLLILDARESALREGGYLPPLAARVEDPQFAGVPVGALDSGRFYSDRWFYDNPVPPEFTTAIGREMLRLDADISESEARRSLLPAVLLTDMDFWINLPMVTDHPALGLNGGMVNATLWNVGNRQRFFMSPANAPVAVAEIAGIPEFQDTWALTLMTLERYQFVGGPGFNSFYTVTEPLLWLSADPVMLDALILERVNKERGQRGFSSLGGWVPYLEFSAELGLGYGDPRRVRLQRVGREQEG